MINCWCPLTHASLCMTTSWPAAATQTTARVSPAMHIKVVFTPDALPAATLPNILTCLKHVSVVEF